MTRMNSSGSESECQSQLSTGRRQEVAVSTQAALPSRSCLSSTSSLVASDVSGDSEGLDSEGRRRRRRWRRRRKKMKRKRRSRVRRKGQEDGDEDEEGGGMGGGGRVPRTARSGSKQVRWKDEFYPWDTFHPVSSVMRDDADLCTRMCYARRQPPTSFGTASESARSRSLYVDHRHRHHHHEDHHQHQQPQQQLTGSRDDSWLLASTSRHAYDPPSSAAVAISQRSSASTSAHTLKLPSSPDSRETVACRYSASSSDRCLLAHCKIHRNNSWLVSSASSRDCPLPSAPAIATCQCSSERCHLCRRSSSSIIRRVSSPVAAGRASGRAQVEAVFLKPSVDLSLCSSTASSSDCPYTLPDVVCSSSSNESGCVSHRLSNFHISSHKGSSSSVAATTSSAYSLGYCCPHSQRRCEDNSSYSARPAHFLSSTHGQHLGGVESDVSPSALLSGEDIFCPRLSGHDGMDSGGKPTQLSTPVSEIHDERKESAAGVGNSIPSVKPNDTRRRNDTTRTRSSGEVGGGRVAWTRSAGDVSKDDWSHSGHSSRAGRFHHEDASAKVTSDSVLKPSVKAVEQTGRCGNSRGGIRETQSAPVSTDFALLSESGQKDRQPRGAPVRHASREAIALLVQRIKREEDLDRCLIPRAVSLEKKSSHGFSPALTPDNISKALGSFTISECQENSSLLSALGSASMESADKFVDFYGPGDEIGDGQSTSSSVISQEQSGVSDKSRSVSEDLNADNKEDQRRRLKRKCSYDSLEVVNSSNNFSVSTAAGCSSLKYAFDLDRSCSRGASFPSESAFDLGKLCSRPSECALHPDKSCSLGISCSRAFGLDKSCGRREPVSKARPESGLGDDHLNFQMSKHPKSLHDLPILSDLEVEFCQQKGWIH